MKILNPDGKVNLHTHTKYCDGTDSPEELVCEAVKRGFSALGFSGHEYSVYDGCLLYTSIISFFMTGVCYRPVIAEIRRTVLIMKS